MSVRPRILPGVLAWLSLLSFTALAGDADRAASPQPEVGVEGNAATYSGLINREGVARLRRLLEAHPAVRELRVDSSGGDPMAALDAGGLVRARGLAVVVDGRCNSACANYLFVPATRRVIRPGALVLWHNSCPQNIPADVKFSDVLAGRHPSISGQATPLGERNRGKTVEDLLDDPAELRRIDRRMRSYFGDWTKRHVAFFRDLPVDGRVVCLGDVLPLPLGPGQGYTLSVADMGAFGLCEVEAEPDYVAKVVETLAREAKSGLAHPVRLSDHPDFRPQPPAGACGPPADAAGTTMETGPA